MSTLSAKVIRSCHGYYVNYTLEFLGAKSYEMTNQWNQEFDVYCGYLEDNNQKILSRIENTKLEIENIKKSMRKNRAWYQFWPSAADGENIHEIHNLISKIENLQSSIVDMSVHDIKSARVKKEWIHRFLSDYGFELFNASGTIEVWKMECEEFLPFLDGGIF